MQERWRLLSNSFQLLGIALLAAGLSACNNPGGQSSPSALTERSLSGCAVAAVRYTAVEYGIPEDRLLVGTYISNAGGVWESNNEVDIVHLPITRRNICIAQVHEKDPYNDTIYTVTLDEQEKPVNLETLRELEKQAAFTECGKGKFAEGLCTRMKDLAEGDEVEVAIWLAPVDGGPIYDTVAENFPPSLQPEKGQPFDIAHPDYEQALLQLEPLIAAAVKEKEQPVLDFLASQGYPAHGVSTIAPLIFARLPKQLILALTERQDVETIYLSEGNFENGDQAISPTQSTP